MSSNPKLRPLTNHSVNEAAVNPVQRPMCDCLEAQYGHSKWSELKLHTVLQDTTCFAWQRLLELIDEAANDGREEFSPDREMTPEQWTQIVTLPASIGRPKAVKHLSLYGSSLVRIPPEVGAMTSLEQFTPYTSYRLHWFPYEMTRCAKLKDSAVSTRALYGNRKYRPPFPRLPQRHDAYEPESCSVCETPFHGSEPLQYWVSLRVG